MYMVIEHELITLLRQKFAKVIENVEEDFETVRVGRAKPSLIENLGVLAYGGHMRLMEVASISAPDSNMLIVSPYDKSLMREIEKAIADSEMKLSPAVSGDIIRIVIPSLTQERRLDFGETTQTKDRVWKSNAPTSQARYQGKD